MCTEKPADSCDSLYFDIRFIVVVWNQTRSIAEVCLCLEQFMDTELEKLTSSEMHQSWLVSPFRYSWNIWKC